jgi:hypothetical protein
MLDAQVAQRVVGQLDLGEEGDLDGAVGQRALFGPVLVALAAGSLLIIFFKKMQCCCCKHLL